MTAAAPVVTALRLRFPGGCVVLSTSTETGQEMARKLIPAANAQHLMLRQDVVDAVGRGQFHVYPIRTVDEGMALLTGLPVLDRDASGEFPEGSLNHLIEARLAEFAETLPTFSGSSYTPV